ncbi:tRNA glutamyl-Q(34) synthetase GluQRS [Castellaniella sp.]|uniref:tRNA glutamyl-Q(34) synthetase GluQRS n=1 Tax=Castellaniella sp. TaxID=1955812 RepID=UPI00355ED25A
MTPYVGRFAPSPSGPLHAGSLRAALASHLDARAHGGRWLLRIEDIDEPRTVPGADRTIMQQLQALGLHWDAPPVWQSQRHPLYAHAFAQLQQARQVYPCHCHRKDLPPGPYPGTCRPGRHNDPRQRDLKQRPAADLASDTPPALRRGESGQAAQATCSWRFQAPHGQESFVDRWYGPCHQDVAAEVGDFIVRRADDLWAYQLVVVVDDGAQGVTDVVRGKDLLPSTARQRCLARALGLQPPRTLHVPLLCDSQGHKLSKQNHAPALTIQQPLTCLQQAWRGLGFAPLAGVRSVPGFLAQATAIWARRFGPRSHGGHPGQQADPNVRIG